MVYNVIVYGVLVKKPLREIKETVRRYNEKTGEPYEKSITSEMYVFGNQTVENDYDYFYEKGWEDEHGNRVEAIWPNGHDYSDAVVGITLNNNSRGYTEGYIHEFVEPTENQKGVLAKALMELGIPPDEAKVYAVTSFSY